MEIYSGDAFLRKVGNRQQAKGKDLLLCSPPGRGGGWVKKYAIPFGSLL